MLIIPIKDGENIDRALKRFKRKFDKTGGMRQLRARSSKPSVRNRQKIQKRSTSNSSEIASRFKLFLPPYVIP